jgi:hypothetical protein
MYNRIWLSIKEDSLLTKEIRSWDKFKYALIDELFDKMLKESQED